MGESCTFTFLASYILINFKQNKNSPCKIMQNPNKISQKSVSVIHLWVHVITWAWFQITLSLVKNYENIKLAWIENPVNHFNELKSVWFLNSFGLKVQDSPIHYKTSTFILLDWFFSFSPPFLHIVFDTNHNKLFIFSLHQCYTLYGLETLFE
jgi:hypothetical protein